MARASAQKFPLKKAGFLKAFAECGTVTSAAEKVKISRRCHYKWMAEDANYKAAFNDLRFEMVGLLEDEAYRRACEGVDEPVFYQGVACGTVRKFSDTLLIVLLKANAPEKYMDRQRVEHHEVADVYKDPLEAFGGRIGSNGHAGSNGNGRHNGNGHT